MDNIINAIKNGMLFNGYIICGNDETTAVEGAKAIADAVNTIPYTLKNPKIDEIRALQTTLFENSLIGEAKIAIIYGDSISAVCQNAMLKLIEESKGDVAVVFGTTNLSTLLSTIISRCVVVYLKDKDEAELLEITKGDRLGARYAMGSAEKAKQIVASKDFFKSRDKALDILMALADGRFVLTDKNDKDEIKDYCKYITLFLTDCATKKPYWFFDKKNIVERFVKTFTTEQIISMIKITEDADIKINKNTNALIEFDRVQIDLLEVVNGKGYRSQV